MNGNESVNRIIDEAGNTYQAKEEEKVKSYDKKVKKLISLGIKPTPNDVCTDCKWYYICKNLD